MTKISRAELTISQSLRALAIAQFRARPAPPTQSANRNCPTGRCLCIAAILHTAGRAPHSAKSAPVSHLTGPRVARPRRRPRDDLGQDGADDLCAYTPGIAEERPAAPGWADDRAGAPEKMAMKGRGVAGGAHGPVARGHRPPPTAPTPLPRSIDRRSGTLMRKSYAHLGTYWGHGCRSVGSAQARKHRFPATSPCRRWGSNPRPSD